MEKDETLFFSDKIICIISENNVKTWWWFLLFELFSFDWNKNKLEFDKKLYENKGLLGVVMPSDNAEILEFKEHWKSDKTLSFIYADLESLIKKTDGCKNNSEKPSTIKVTKNSPCGYSIYLIWTFHGIENKHNVHWGKQCIKKFSESLKEHAMKKINFEKKIIPLTNKAYKSWSNCHLCKKKKKMRR